MIVIATPSDSKRCTVTEEHRERFLVMLPQIRQQASMACRRLHTEARQEFMQGVIADAYAAFIRLVQLGKVDLAYATPLAQYSIRHVRAGRSVGTRLNRRDISSPYGQNSRRCLIQRLDRRYADGSWKEILVEDHRTGPAEVACARIDFSTWLDSLSVWKRRIAKDLAYGHRTEDVAQKHGVSSARISQLRREFSESWGSFQRDLPPALTRRARLAPSRRVVPALCAGQSAV